MGGRLKGITITLFEQTQVGTDAFNRPVYAEEPVEVENVLIGEPSSQDITDTLNLSGKKLAYTLAIPKGDTHEWTNGTVEFFGERFRTIGNPTEGIEDMIPLDWNKKVKVERYE